MSKLLWRSRTLSNYHASDEEVKELLAYNHNVFETSELQTFPLPSEPHLKVWEEYGQKAQEIGVYEALKAALVQLNFPILEGISKTEDYRRGTLSGASVKSLKIATGLRLREPEKLQFKIYSTLAGEIPVIIAGNRPDFVSLIQALTKKNEPVAIPDSIGACMIGGYNNWDRINRYQNQWLANNLNSLRDWQLEFKRLIPQKELYQDRFIILSPGFYSNVAPEDLGLTEKEWLEMSLSIRLEHEVTHYFTRRVFGSMRNNLLDELIADYQGIVKATGFYRSDWFLHFLGLENFPVYRQGGRLENYRGEPSLSQGAFKILQTLVKEASQNLQEFHQKFYTDHELNVANQVAVLMALTTLTLEELASKEAMGVLLEKAR